MNLLIVINVIAISVCVHSLPTLSTENGIDKNTTCDVVLDFSNMSLSIINPHFISNPYIKTLALRSNGISGFQDNTFDSLPSLETLDVSNNQLTPTNLFSFGNLYALKSLILDNNPVSYHKKRLSIDPYYYSDCSVGQYYTGNNRCEYYSQLEVKYDYPKLTHLSIRNVVINSIASDLADHFPNLKHLDISENYFHTTSAEVLTYLPTSVTSLTMRNVGLTALEGSKLKNIVYLDLNDNVFETLSSHYCFENTLCLRNFTNLESLKISHCSIKKIETDAFKDVTKLNYLDVSSNDFEEIPEGTFEFLSGLSYLDLSNTKLNVIPDFSNLQNLTSLYMNNMQNSHELFSQAGLERFLQLPNLEALSLRKNELKTVPLSFLNKLPKLSELNLSNNKIESLPSWQWQNNLRRLILNDNAIKSLEGLSLQEAESLELLNLENNKFTQIKLKALKHLSDDVILKI